MKAINQTKENLTETIKSRVNELEETTKIRSVAGMISAILLFMSFFLKNPNLLIIPMILIPTFSAYELARKSQIIKEIKAYLNWL